MTYYRLLQFHPQIGITLCDDVGNYYTELPVGAVAVDSPPVDQAMHELRQYRNMLLQNTDYTQLEDAPLTPAQKEAFRDYRQELRDYPEKIDTAAWSGPPWPVAPVL